MQRLLVAIAALLGAMLCGSPGSLRGDDALTQQVTAFEQAITQLRGEETAAGAAVVDSKTKLQALEQQKFRFDRQEQTGTTALAELAKQKPDKENAAVQAQMAAHSRG